MHPDDLAAIDDYSYELRTSSDTVVLNQAGDRIAGYWQQREQRSADSASVRLVQWPFAGTRDRSEPGVVYDVTWEDHPEVTAFSFVSSGPYVTVTLTWDGVLYDLERQVNQVAEFDEHDQGTVVDRASIKPHLPPELIETLATPELRFQAEVANRAPLHPNEIDMLDAVVDAMSARIDAYLPASGVDQVAHHRDDVQRVQRRHRVLHDGLLLRPAGRGGPRLPPLQAEQGRRVAWPAGTRSST